MSVHARSGPGTSRLDAQRMWLRRMDPAPQRLLAAAAWFAFAFWAYYAFLRQVAGPLNPDEIYFSHTLWLLNEGKRQYVDFYSGHLPAYFALLKPLVSALSREPSDLSFVWGVRSLSAAIILGYLGLAFILAHKVLRPAGRVGVLALGALLFLFVVLARMVEIRTDTFGLLLVNAAWALVLCSRSTRTMVAAAILAGLALLFSARAAGMVAVIGVVLVVLAVRARDAARVRALFMVAALFLGAAIAGYLAAPEWVALVLRSCFLQPAQILHGPTLMTRFLALERLPLTILIVAGLAAGASLMRHGNKERGLVVAVACAAQLLMIGLDPAPFLYVYGWAAVPAALGLASLGPGFALCVPFCMAAGLLATSLGYSAVYGRVPPTISYFRLTFDRPLGAAAVARLSTQELVSLLISDRDQKNLANQLRIRSELCRRLPGKVLTTFDTHPICLDDATFYWTGLRWPPLVDGDAAAPQDMSRQDFARAFSQARPRLFIWRHKWEQPRPLLAATRQLLACCYDVEDSFAISKAGGAPAGPAE